MNYYADIPNRISIAAVFALAVLFFLAVAPAIGANSKSTGEEMKGPGQEIKEAAAAISEYSVEQKDAAVAKAREMMDDLDVKMDAWQGSVEKNWGELKQTSQEKYQESLRSLREQRNELSEWYGSMKYSSMEAWDETKKGFAQTYDKVVETFSTSEEQVDATK